MWMAYCAIVNFIVGIITSLPKEEHSIRLGTYHSVPGGHRETIFPEVIEVVVAGKDVRIITAHEPTN